MTFIAFVYLGFIYCFRFLKGSLSWLSTLPIIVFAVVVVVVFFFFQLFFFSVVS